MSGGITVTPICRFSGHHDKRVKHERGDGGIRGQMIDRRALFFLFGLSAGVILAIALMLFVSS